MAQFISAEEVEIEGEKGTLFTYEVTATSERLARRRVEIVSTARFPRKAGASRVVSSRETGRGLIRGYEVQIFLLSDDLVNKLGVERAIDGLQELGIL